MKSLYLLLFTLLLAVNSHAQTESYHPARFQAGFYAGDFILTGDLIFDASYRFHKRHVFGISSGYMQDRDGLYATEGNEALWRGTDSRSYHKMYLGCTVNQNYFYVRHGLRFREGTFNYPIEDFFPFEENGNTFLRKETRSFTENTLQFGYEMVLGFEVNYRYVFMEYYIGAAASTAYHNSPEEYREEEMILNDPRFSGFRPLAGIRVGIYLY